jgi:putative transposase
MAVNLMCEHLNVSRSGYYAWRTRPVSRREMANKALLEKIRVAYAASKGRYGSPRIYEEVKDEMPCSLNRVARLMRQQAIVAKQTKRYKTTTRRNEHHTYAPNHLAQDFTAGRPAEKWCGDITYIGTAAGWLYLAVVIDLYSRRIVGWALNARMTTQLVIDAFQMARQQCRSTAGLIFHSDRGSQYTSYEFQGLLQKNKVQASMSGTGNCYDNAVVESFFGTLKMELIHHTAYQTREEAMTDIFLYIESFYNRKRRHSTLGYVSPLAYEACYQQQVVT